MAGRTNLQERQVVQIVQVYERGLKIPLIMQTFGVSRATIYRLVQNYKNKGRVEIQTKSRRTKKLSVEAQSRLRQMMQENCSITLESMNMKFAEEFGINFWSQHCGI